MHALRFTPAAVLLVPLLVAACAPEQPAEDAMPGAAMVEPMAVDVEAVRTDVSIVRDTWIAAADVDDAPGVAALYADDAVLVGPDGTTRQGRAAIEATFAEDFPSVTSLQVTPTDFEATADMATELGEFTQTVTTPEGEQTINGRYLVVLRRQDDGAWRIVQHISTVPQPAS